MKDDYLWDKTGGDAEIERLELELAAFRYKELPPPELPAKVLPLPSRLPRKLFRFDFAFALALSVIVVMCFVWLRQPKGELIVAENLAEPEAMPTAADVRQPDVVQPEEIDDVPYIKPTTAKIRSTEPAANRKIKPTSRRPERRAQVVKLTKEEKYAYDQLMLALSITSSKLSIVKDTLDEIDRPEPARRERQTNQK